MTVIDNHVFIESIPAELKARAQWVVWKKEVRGDKPTKVPYNAAAPRYGAKSDDPTTWVPFDKALDALIRSGFDGIGYVFSVDDPYCGIDLDGAIKEDGTLHEWADDITRTLNSYTEVSPSGNGLHILVKGKLPDGNRRKKPVEMYDTGRYFTITGQQWLDAPDSIFDRQSELEAIHKRYIPVSSPIPSTQAQATTPTDLSDNDLIERAKRAANGRKFEDLWNGVTQGYDSASEADLALAGILLFWAGGDTNKADRLFRMSGLMREKWDTKHNNKGQTYGQLTLERALSGMTKFYEPLSPRHSAKEEKPSLLLTTINPDAPRHTDSFRPLPYDVMQVYEHLDPNTSRWLFEYVEFAQTASPMTPVPFHQAAALFAVSTLIARRLCLKVSTEEIFPNLFILFLARSTIYSKTTGFKLIETLFREAGLHHHLLPQRMTPEAMLMELSLNMPNGLNLSDAESRTAWLKERAFAAQRGWMLDEAHSLLDGLKRDFNVGLMAMLLKMYDCPKATVEQTVGRGRVTVKNGYLSFFGATTPASAADHLTNSLLWQNGMWARFALVTYDEDSKFQFFPNALEMPQMLVEQFSRFSELFPAPRAELVEVEDIDGSKRKVVELVNVTGPSTVTLEKGVWQAWEAYTRFVRHDLLNTKSVDDELFGSYGRMGTLVIKVAMILAVMDTDYLPVTVTLSHYALAQSIVEEWRESLHRLRDHVLTSTENTQRDRVLDLLTRAGSEGLILRDIYRPLNMPAKKVKEHLEDLKDSGQVELYEAFATNGRKVQMAKRILSTPGGQPSEEAA